MLFLLFLKEIWGVADCVRSNETIGQLLPGAPQPQGTMKAGLASNGFQSGEVDCGTVMLRAWPRPQISNDTPVNQFGHTFGSGENQGKLLVCFLSTLPKRRRCGPLLVLGELAGSAVSAKVFQFVGVENRVNAEL